MTSERRRAGGRMTGSNIKNVLPVTPARRGCDHAREMTVSKGFERRHIRTIVDVERRPRVPAHAALDSQICFMVQLVRPVLPKTKRRTSRVKQGEEALPEAICLLASRQSHRLWPLAATDRNSESRAVSPGWVRPACLSRAGLR